MTSCFSDVCARALSEENPSEWYKNIFSRPFFARGLAQGDCNAVSELESHNLELFFRAVQIKNQTVGWVARPLDLEAVFPKENELVEVCGFLSYAGGLAHAAALEPHVAYALHRYSILHASVLMFCGLDCASLAHRSRSIMPFSRYAMNMKNKIDVAIICSADHVHHTNKWKQNGFIG